MILDPNFFLKVALALVCAAVVSCAAGAGAPLIAASSSFASASSAARDVSSVVERRVTVLPTCSMPLMLSSSSFIWLPETGDQLPFSTSA